MNSSTPGNFRVVRQELPCIWIWDLRPFVISRIDIMRTDRSQHARVTQMCRLSGQSKTMEVLHAGELQGGEAGVAEVGGAAQHPGHALLFSL